VRRGQLLERKHQQLGHELGAPADPAEALVEALDDELGDDLLRLIFTSCHPVLPPDARVALTLRLVGGLSTEEIARAFLVPVQTIQQRIVRAKKQPRPTSRSRCRAAMISRRASHRCSR